MSGDVIAYAADTPLLRLRTLLLIVPLLLLGVLHAGINELYRSTVVLLVVPFCLVQLSVMRAPRLPLRSPLLQLALVLGFLAYALSWVSVVKAPHPVPALLRQCEVTALILFGLCVASWVQEGRGRATVVLAAACGGFLLVAALIALQWLALDEPRRHDWIYQIAGVGHLRHLGFYAVGAALLAAPGLLHTARGRWQPLLAATALTLALALILWSGGRGSLVAVVCGLVALTLWMPGRLRRAWGLRLGLCALGGVVLAVVFATEHPAMNLLRWEAAAPLRWEGQGDWSSSRFGLWQESLGYLEQRPWLGWGPDGYKFLPLSKLVLQPHNAYLNAALSWGVPGLLLALAALLLLGARGLQLVRQEAAETRDVTRAAALALLGALLVYGLVDGVFYFSVPLLFTALACALLAQPPQFKLPHDAARVASPPRAFRLWLRGAKPLGLGLGAAAGLLLGLNLYQLHAYFGPAPAPDSPAARFARAFPNTTFGYWNWLQSWEATHPQAALEGYAWAVEHSAVAWRYHQMEADFRFKLGDIWGAALCAEACLQTVPERHRPVLAERFQPLLDYVRRQPPQGHAVQPAAAEPEAQPPSPTPAAPKALASLPEAS